MKPIITTKAPLVFKVFKTHFHISGNGKSDKDEDNYEYKDLESLSYKKGKQNINKHILEWLTEVLIDVGNGDDEDSDEFIITFKSGKSESRFLHGTTSKEHLQAVEKINEFISSSTL